MSIPLNVNWRISTTASGVVTLFKTTWAQLGARNGRHTTIFQFNSWDREPYYFNPNCPTDATPLPIVIHQNLFMNNYHFSSPIDNDDGSNNYIETQNFLLWGGSKDYL